MTHTPGPWKVNNFDDDRIGFCIGPNDDYEEQLARTYGNQPEDLANARLIAAAPELLEACKMALAQIKQDNDERKIGEEYRGTEWQVKQAISKAEGKP